jgi:integrase
MKLGEEIDLLLQNYEIRFKSKDISLNSLRAAKHSLGKLKIFWGHHHCEKLNKETWEKFQIKYDEKYHETQFNLCKFATVLANFLYNKGAISKKPEIKNMFARRERDARRKKKNWLLTKEQIEALDKACRTDKEKLGIQLGHRLAFRISDVVNLSWERIVIVSGENRAFIEFSGEDDKAGFVGRCPLPNDLVELLLRIEKKGPWVFPQSRDPSVHLITQQFPFNEIKKRAKLPEKCGFHDLRRYRLSLDFKNTKLTPALVCKMRRISLPIAMENYVKTNDEDMDLILKESK